MWQVADIVAAGLFPWKEIVPPEYSALDRQDCIMDDIELNIVT
jgi:hypothetical protein